MAQGAAAQFRARGEEEQYLLAQNLIGAVALQRGKLAEAERTFRVVIAGAEPLGNLDIVGGALNNLGAIASIRGDREEALRCYERALAAFIRTGNEHRLAHTYHNLALAYRDAGLYQEADALFAEVAERARAVGDEWLATVAVTARAEMTLRGEVQDLGAIDAAARQALVRFDVFASTLGQAEAQKLAGMVAASRGDLATAARRLTDAIELAAKHGNPLLVAEARYERGVVRLGLSQVEGAREDLTGAIALFTELGHDDGAKRARHRLEDACRT